MFPVPDAVEIVLTPGAEMSGLKALSPFRGPPELKLAKARNAGFVSVVAVVETDVAARSALASGLVDGPWIPETEW